MTRFLVVATAIALTACDSDLLTVTEDFDAADVTFSVPATTEAGAFLAVGTVDGVNLRARLDDNDLDEDNLRSVVVQSMRATITDPRGEFSFDDIADGQVLFSGGSLAPTVVAMLPDASSGTTATLEVRDDDIKAYLLQDEFVATVSGTSTAAVPEGVTLTLATAYEFTGGL